MLSNQKEIKIYGEVRNITIENTTGNVYNTGSDKDSNRVKISVGTIKNFSRRGKLLPFIAISDFGSSKVFTIRQEAVVWLLEEFFTE